MQIVDTTIPINANQLEIPSYHLGHLSLKTGTGVTMCLLPARPEQTSPQMREMVISPISFDSWQFLARISAVFFESAGVVRKITRALKDLEIDILYQESASIENGRFHRVELLIDPRTQYGRFEGQENPDRAVLGSIERRLKARCLNDLIFDGSRARLKARRMEGLRNAWLEYRERSDETTAVERSIVNSSMLVMPSEVIAALGNPPPERAILISDTKDRLLRVMFPNNFTGFTYIRVTHNDSVGAIAAITDRLSDAFNAILTLNRLKTQGERNDVELLLFCEEYPGIEDDKTRQGIAETLLDNPAVHHLDILVTYPERSGARGKKGAQPVVNRAVTWKSITNVVSLEPEYHGESTVSILRDRIDKYAKGIHSASDLATGNSIRNRIDAAKRLLVHEGLDTLPRPTVFVSYDFEHQELYDIAAPQLTRRKCEVTNGKDAFEVDRFRDVIRERIRRSSGFIAIWKMRDDDTFSPWLVWELGVAQAFEIPFCILVHKNVAEAPHVRINPETHHIDFIDSNFKDKLTKRLPKFIEDVAKREGAVIRRRASTSLEDDPWEDP